MEIVLTGVAKSYGDQPALYPLDLTVKEGEFVTLLGPSGCGKTTLLRIIAGFVTPNQGRVYLGDTDITDRPANRREVGLLFQSYALFPHMTVAQNVAFGLKVRRLSKRRLAEQVERMLDLVSMSEYAGRYPKQLSGGQQQRVALARILAIEPKVLLLDEPLSALDRQLRIQMQLELARLIAEVGITTMFVTHDQEEALTMSDRIAVMDRGTIAQYDTPGEVYDHPSSEFVASFIGRSNLIKGQVVPGGAAGGAQFRFGPHSLPLRADAARGAAGLADGAEPPEAAGGRAATSGIGHREGGTAGERTLLVRPDHLELLPATATAGLPGTVATFQDLGEAFIYGVDVADGPQLTVRVPRGRSEGLLAVGTPVRVALNEAAAEWLIPAPADSRVGAS
ncbi:MAG: ABC transporter ATP-binding protein [Bifidobacteriaceae bacterium]|jgi:ABC-type Fe3+/spermidine/putrescine transport system ATPase subunit|nr:ABC transporter ATP-binding protein [Bifidobacteriaceae bacterium]